jgi:uncharacterized protein YqjF (DUF2071 family)
MIKTFLSARWENLVMANYEVNPDILRPYLPKGVELDLYEGKAMVSLVGFMFKKTRLFRIPIPFMGTFEEVNLRFYVKRIDGNEIKRGVVFINETVPNKPVAWIANKLYKEHYIAIPTKHTFQSNREIKSILYRWKINQHWNEIKVEITHENNEMIPESIEEFIFEHYYGYTKISPENSQEYRVNHPRWKVNKVLDFSINCDYEAMYGNDFTFLNNQTPHSVIFAIGSDVTVDWKRRKF